jgi:hypothetical protein
MKHVARIDTLREFAATTQPPMFTPRRCHSSVYHAERLYVLGGLTGATKKTDPTRTTSKFERFVCAESRWETLPCLPRASACIGGSGDAPADMIQKLSLESLSWELIRLKLPRDYNEFPCFKVSNSQVYFVFKDLTLYSFMPQTLQIKPVKTVPKFLKSCGGPSHYSRGFLYFSSENGTSRLEIGSLK